jgi:hypothetical protein
LRFFRKSSLPLLLLEPNSAWCFILPKVQVRSDFPSFPLPLMVMVARKALKAVGKNGERFGSRQAHAPIRSRAHKKNETRKGPAAHRGTPDSQMTSPLHGLTPCLTRGPSGLHPGRSAALHLHAFSVWFPTFWLVRHGNLRVPYITIVFGTYSFCNWDVPIRY